MIKHFAGKVPILGVCLGHQSIGEAFGGDVIRAPYLMHGKTSMIHHDGRTIFAGCRIPSRRRGTIRSSSSGRRCRPRSRSSAWTDDGIIMGVRHKQFKVEGVQFHPESILTGAGKDLLRNFLKL